MSEPVEKTSSLVSSDNIISSLVPSESGLRDILMKIVYFNQLLNELCLKHWVIPQQEWGKISLRKYVSCKWVPYGRRYITTWPILVVRWLIDHKHPETPGSWPFPRSKCRCVRFVGSVIQARTICSSNTRYHSIGLKEKENQETNPGRQDGREFKGKG